MGICGSTPSVKQEIKPAASQNGHQATVPQASTISHPPAVVSDVPAVSPSVQGEPPATEVVGDLPTCMRQLLLTDALSAVYILKTQQYAADSRAACAFSPANLAGRNTCQL